MTDDTFSANLSTFRDCISGPLIARSAKPPVKYQEKRQTRGRRNHNVKHSRQASYAAEENSSDAEELADFIDVGQSCVLEMRSYVLTPLVHRDRAIRSAPPRCTKCDLLRRTKQSASVSDGD